MSSQVCSGLRPKLASNWSSLQLPCPFGSSMSEVKVFFHDHMVSIWNSHVANLSYEKAYQIKNIKNKITKDTSGSQTHPGPLHGCPVIQPACWMADLAAIIFQAHNPSQTQLRGLIKPGSPPRAAKTAQHGWNYPQTNYAERILYGCICIYVKACNYAKMYS